MANKIKDTTSNNRTQSGLKIGKTSKRLTNIEQKSLELETTLNILERMESRDPVYEEILKQANELAATLRVALNFN